MNELKGFGERLKTAIKNSNFSQKDISEILQINQDTITNYVKEKSMPNADVIYRICRLLKITSDYLLFGEVPQENKTELLAYSDDKIGKISDNEADMIIKFRKLNYEAQEDIRDFIDMKFDRRFKRGTSSSSTTGGTGEEAAASETA